MCCSLRLNESFTKGRGGRAVHSLPALLQALQGVKKIVPTPSQTGSHIQNGWAASLLLAQLRVAGGRPAVLCRASKLEATRLELTLGSG